jgi:Kinesin motor domain
MGSEAHADLDIGESSGLIPRFMNDFFCALAVKKEKADETQNGFNYQLHASFLEVYGEDVHDLLDKSRQALPLRENETGGIVCTGLTAKTINNVSQALEVLHEGTMNRTTAATLMNLTSSRSHAVFTVTLTQHETRQNTGSKNQVEITSTSRFTFVDLAGSERMKKTGAEGERAREGIRINEGLLALGNVINALADDDRLQEGKKIHVPYRQSKLTRLLQDALGGNSQTLFLACVSPSDTNASETLSTLRYANRARNIKNVASRNVDSAALEMQRLHSYIGVLQAELIKCRFTKRSRTSGSSFDSFENTVDDDNLLGQCDDVLSQRKDVVDYIEKLANIAQGSSGMEAIRFVSNPVNGMTMVPMTTKVENSACLLTSPRKLLPLQPRNVPVVERSDSPLHNKSILEDFDPAFLGETNPDEEMAILDQLLDIQHQDQLFDNEKKKDSAELKQVDGELAEQEILLLQLRKSLEVYHGMKIKYENLLTEVQQLETEKAQLAKKLQHATADPSQGCSSTIKREMEKVEQSLIRARNETRKHRELYRKAEMEAQKCKALERKIAELKTSRAQLIKKQKETVARHREYTETKTREILSLKRKGKKTEQELSKLQRNVEAHQRNMNKRQAYCNNLSAKLKQTESHLMKLLSMRQRDLRGGNKSNGERHDTGKSSKVTGKEKTLSFATDKEEHFAKDTPELDSVKFLIDKHIHEKINQNELKRQYKDCYSRYSEAMRHLVNTVRITGTSNENNPEDPENINQATEEMIEELELKVDLASNELERVKMQLSSFEKPASTEDNDENTFSLMSTLKREKAPLLRSLLLDTISSFVDTEVRVCSHHYYL